MARRTSRRSSGAWPRGGDYALTPAAEEKATACLEAAYERRTATFGNARLARNLFEQTISRHSDRIAPESGPSDDALRTLTPPTFR